MTDQIKASNEFPRMALGYPKTEKAAPETDVIPPSLVKKRGLINADPPRKLDDDGEFNDMLPDFIRGRSMPTRHHVATEQVDRELTMRNDAATSGISGDLIGLKKDNGDDKDETWNRLNELAKFAMCGFGFFKTLVGAGTYNRERKNRQPHR